MLDTRLRLVVGGCLVVLEVVTPTTPVSWADKEAPRAGALTKLYSQSQFGGDSVHISHISPHTQAECHLDLDLGLGYIN